MNTLEYFSILCMGYSCISCFFIVIYTLTTPVLDYLKDDEIKRILLSWIISTFVIGGLGLIMIISTFVIGGLGLIMSNYGNI